MKRTTLRDVGWWIKQVESSRNGEQFDGPSFMLPYHFGVLACEVHRQGATHLTVPEWLQGYAARMRLWQAIGLRSPTKVNERNPGGRFFPLTAISSESTAEDIAQGVGEMFHASGTTDHETLNAINIALSEICSNCFFHAEAGAHICGLACAQAWPAQRLAQVAVADIGIGIRASLKANPEHRARLANGNANEIATELGITSKPEGPHSGFGLAVARQLMEKHGGNFLLLSGNEGFRATSTYSWARKLPGTWHGTIVVLEWNTDRPFDIGAVYGSWPSDGESDDFF